MTDGALAGRLPLMVDDVGKRGATIEPRALLFDIDGTLIDSAGAGGRALLAAFGAEFHCPEPRPVALHGRTDLGIMMELFERNGLEFSTERLQRLCVRYFQVLPETLAACMGRVLPGVRDVLERLVGVEQCHVGLLTGNMQRSAHLKLSHFGLDHFFEFGIYGDLAAARPGLAEPARQVLRGRLGGDVPPRRIVVLGDTPLDIELARALNARCLAVCTGGYVSEQLQSADCVVPDMGNADEVLDWCLQ